MSLFSFRADQRRATRNSRKSKTESAPRVTPLQLAGELARGADYLLTASAAVILALILLYTVFVLWDNWRIYDRARVDKSLFQYKPRTEGDVDGKGLADLMEINPDVCAWLTVDGTYIDYPVVQGSDNMIYINTDVYGEFSLSGSIFLDFQNNRDFSDTYSLIHGHHMDGKVMFGELDDFIQPDYFEAHTSGMLYLPEDTCQIEWFACLKADAYDRQIFSPGNHSVTDQESLLEYIRENALQYRDIGVTNEDRVLALSTCSDTSTNARIILAGRLRESDDSKEVEG